MENHENEDIFDQLAVLTEKVCLNALDEKVSDSDNDSNAESCPTGTDSSQNSSVQQRLKKLFCSWCYKGRREYMHRLKDPYGNIMCPDLLSKKCQYCRQRGHFMSHCRVRLSNNRNQHWLNGPNQEMEFCRELSGYYGQPTANYPLTFESPTGVENQSVQGSFQQNIQRKYQNKSTIKNSDDIFQHFHSSVLIFNHF
jgi:hypothetical protein